MKIEILKLSLAALIGALTYAYIAPSPKPEIQVVEKVVEVKSGVITRKTVTKPDGSQQIDEVEQYLSNRQSDVSIIQKPQEKKNVVAIIPKYDLSDKRSSIGVLYTNKNIGIYLSSDKQVGLVLSYQF